MSKPAPDQETQITVRQIRVALQVRIYKEKQKRYLWQRNLLKEKQKLA
jgi:hypothetical protein